MRFELETAQFVINGERIWIKWNNVRQLMNDCHEAFMNNVKAGLERRFDAFRNSGKEVTESIYWNRLNNEINTISRINADLEKFFLMFRDYILWLKNNGVGVGAGCPHSTDSLVMYALEITDIDPIEHSLVFERFINEEAYAERHYSIMPVIALFVSEFRPELFVQFVMEKFGSDCCVVQIDEDLSLYCEERQFLDKHGFVDFFIYESNTVKLINNVLQRVNLNCEQSGMVRLDLNQIPLNDEYVLNSLIDSELLSVWKCCDSIQDSEWRLKVKPDCLNDYIVISAITSNDLIFERYLDSYINRKRGLEKIVYLHPCLENILKETYGLLLFDEQLMMATQVIANFSYSSADMFRRDVGKRKTKRCEKWKKKFTEGAAQNGIELEKALELYDYLCEGLFFTCSKGYCVSITLDVYRLEYLKHHYPVE